jgi:hypothetical protein
MNKLLEPPRVSRGRQVGSVRQQADSLSTSL